MYKYRFVDDLWFSTKTSKTNGRNGLIYQDYGYKLEADLLIEDFIMVWPRSFDCCLGLWELDREKGDAAERIWGWS